MGHIFSTGKSGKGKGKQTGKSKRGQKGQCLLCCAACQASILDNQLSAPSPSEARCRGVADSPASQGGQSGFSRGL